MRAPAFWRENGAAARLLSPLGALYGAIARKRLAREAPRANLPTVVIGGLTAGGDGKTPLAIAVAQRLKAAGERPALLTRGYRRERGGNSSFVVDLTHHGADDVGDEALLLARAAPTIVGADRMASAALAERLGATVVILDDGFHSRRVTPDLTLIVIDSDYGAGNGRCMPAGPLRAPLDAQLAAADMLVVIGDGERGRDIAARANKPTLAARLAPDPKAAEAMQGARIVAFAGIARPEKFFRSLEGMRRRCRGAGFIRRSSPFHAKRLRDTIEVTAGAWRAARHDGKGCGANGRSHGDARRRYAARHSSLR